jgi:hypothetical protein
MWRSPFPTRVMMRVGAKIPGDSSRVAAQHSQNAIFAPRFPLSGMVSSRVAADSSAILLGYRLFALKAARNDLTNTLIKLHFSKSSKKIAFLVKKHLRVLTCNRRTPFTGGAEARLVGQTDGRSGALEGSLVRNQRHTGRGALRDFSASSFVLLLRCLTLLLTEEICGRFGSLR